MDIQKSRNGGELTVTLSGRLDTTTAPALETELRGCVDAGVEKLIMDFTGIGYVSSAGLRVILAAQKQMSRQGEMTLRGVCDEVMEVFEMTGFTDILTFE